MKIPFAKLLVMAGFLLAGGSVLAGEFDTEPGVEQKYQYRIAVEEQL